NLWQWISQGEGDCVVSDVIMPDGDAFELLPRIKNARPELPVILISAQNTFMTALKAQEAQAYEYLPKPFDLEALLSAVDRAIFEPKDNRSTQTVQAYGEDMPLVGRSDAMQQIYRAIARLRQSDFPVMISGETGTGKHLTAQVLHNYGMRSNGPFVTVNLAALPEDGIERELFGTIGENEETVPGAILKADGGTLFLKNISQMPTAIQARLLQVLMEGKVFAIGSTTPVDVDVRVISSTASNLDTNLRNGTFREDLFYRLNVVPLHVPALKERVEDIPDLARHFVKMAESDGATSKHLEADAVKILKDHVWPGNIRELENMIKRVCIMHPQETISAGQIRAEIKGITQGNGTTESTKGSGFNSFADAAEYYARRYFDTNSGNMEQTDVHKLFLEELEYPLITAALSATNGNQLKAASILGLNRNTLRKKIKELGIRIVKTAK
ncbi:MAG: sigma 54-interacting transcriptional regulator, partial [Pseudomonadota bacterium]